MSPVGISDLIWSDRIFCSLQKEQLGTKIPTAILYMKCEDILSLNIVFGNSIHYFIHYVAEFSRSWQIQQ
jgi:hypothetical protein